MKTYLSLLLLFLSTLVYGQEVKHKERGKLNKRGYFQFKDHATQLEFLDVNRRDRIDGNSYFYFTAIEKKNGKKNLIVMDINSDFARNRIKKFSSLKNGLRTDMDYELTQHIVNDSVYSGIRQMSDDEFFSKYIEENSEFGVIEIIEDWEVRKAVLLRLLKSRIPIGQHDVSGDWLLIKHRISW